jgi:hypothetical protein
MVAVIPARRRWLAGALLVGVGWLAAPSPVAVYDGLAAPDEPYRYVSPPPGVKTAPPTSTAVDTPVQNGGNVRGLSFQTSETGPQVSAFLPQYALSATSGPIHITVSPAAPTDPPPGATVDGNVYVFTLSSPAGDVGFDPVHGANATLYLRATSQRTPQPGMYFRPDAQAAWTALPTTSGGLDIRVASFKGKGEYVLALAAAVKAKAGGGAPVLPLVLVGILVVLAAVVLVVRLQARSG